MRTYLIFYIPDPSKKTTSSVPVDRKMRRKSALKRSKGTATGSRKSMTTEYAGASKGRIPRLLAARPTRMLTMAALNMLPIAVLSDLPLSFLSQTPKKKSLGHI